MLNKKVLAVLLSAILFLAAIPCYISAENVMNVAAEKVNVEYGASAASVSINVSGNPGMAMLGFEIDYDSENMKLGSVVVSEDVFAGSDVIAGNLDRDPYMFSAANYSADTTGNGILITLNFDINADCPVGSYPIKLLNAEAYSIDENIVDVTLNDGEIVITESSAPISFTGAQIRTEGVQGLRFVFEMDAETYSLLSEDQLPQSYDDTGIGFGSVVIPAKLLGDADLTKETENAKIVPAVKLFSQPAETVTYTACITYVAEENYTREYVAVPYITYLENGVEKTIYGEQTENITVFNVAESAYADESAEQSVRDYLYENILAKVDPDYEK